MELRNYLFQQVSERGNLIEAQPLSYEQLGRLFLLAEKDMQFMTIIINLIKSSARARISDILKNNNNNEYTIGKEIRLVNYHAASDMINLIEEYGVERIIREGEDLI